MTPIRVMLPVEAVIVTSDGKAHAEAYGERHIDHQVGAPTRPWVTPLEQPVAVVSGDEFLVSTPVLAMPVLANVGGSWKLVVAYQPPVLKPWC